MIIAAKIHFSLHHQSFDKKQCYISVVVKGGVRNVSVKDEPTPEGCYW